MNWLLCQIHRLMPQSRPQSPLFVWSAQITRNLAISCFGIGSEDEIGASDHKCFMTRGSWKLCGKNMAKSWLLGPCRASLIGNNELPWPLKPELLFPIVCCSVLAWTWMTRSDTLLIVAHESQWEDTFQPGLPKPLLLLSHAQKRRALGSRILWEYLTLKEIAPGFHLNIKPFVVNKLLSSFPYKFLSTNGNPGLWRASKCPLSFWCEIESKCGS